jgi:heme/copper-type cytochrome/quinol oxidase subunit 2
MLEKNVILYYDNINKLDGTIHNILLYTIFITTLYIIMKIDYIASIIIELRKIKTYIYKNNNTQLNKDIQKWKSKSLDTIETNIVLQQKIWKMKYPLSNIININVIKNLKNSYHYMINLTNFQLHLI